MVFFRISWLAIKRRQGRRFVGGERAALVVILLLAGSLSVAQEPAEPRPAEQPVELFHRVISNQKRNEETLDLFERVQSVDIRQTASDATAGDQDLATIPDRRGHGQDPAPERGKLP